MLKTTTKPQPIEKILQTIERQLHDLNRIERERERLAAGNAKALERDLITLATIVQPSPNKKGASYA